MPAKEIPFRELESMVGKDLGVSEWHEVTQDAVNMFADATGDHQWIHVDVERSKRESPFGGPIAHGYFTLSLLPMLMGQVWTVTDVRMGINYGLNRLRFPSPVPVGSKVRAHATLKEFKFIEGGAQLEAAVTIEIEGGDKPCCYAESVSRVYV